MKVIVIGVTHAGTAAINSIYAYNKDVEVTAYERNDNISFLSCGIALWVSGEVKDPAGLFYSSPETLAELGTTMKMQHDVTSVDLDKKEVQVKNLQTGEEFTDTFDKLVVTTGSWPIEPKIPGIEDQRVVLSKNYDHAKAIVEAAKQDDIKNVVVVGGGYIGTELVEAFQTQGKNVTLIDGMDRILNKYFDEPFTDRVTKSFEDNGITVKTSELVQEFKSSDDAVTVVTDKGEYPADLVVMSIGFKPNTELFKDKLDMNPDGSIKTDDYMRSTNYPDVYGAGDSVAVHYNPTGKDAYIPLATNAVRQGTLVGMNLQKEALKYMGTQSTSGLMLYSLSMASSGLTLESAKEQGIDADSYTMEDNYRPEFMSSTEKVLMTVVYEKGTNRIIGGQLQSKYDISQSANTISMMIQNKMTLVDMAFVDMLFQPWFDRPFHYLNLLAQGAIAAQK